MSSVLTGCACLENLTGWVTEHCLTAAATRCSDKATGWEALENPEPEEGCVWDIFTAIYEWGEVKVAEARILWRQLSAAVSSGVFPPPPPPPPPPVEAAGCMEGWAGAECDECAPGYSGEDCDQKEL